MKDSISKLWFVTWAGHEGAKQKCSRLQIKLNAGYDGVTGLDLEPFDWHNSTTGGVKMSLWQA